MDGLGCSLPIDFYAALPSLLLSTLSVVKNLLMGQVLSVLQNASLQLEVQ